MDKSRLMFQMTVKEVRNGLKDMKTVVVPIGVVEQHGYHLPLSVDIHNSVEIANMASAISGCFVAPSLNYCFSGGTLPGTINLSPQVFSMVLMDIYRSLVMQGFKNIIVLLGHGGTENVQAARDSAENFQRLSPDMGDITVSLVPFWELSPTYMQCFTEGDFHAGKYETSLMLYWKPELVRMDEMELDTPELVERMRTDQDAFLSSQKLVDNKFVIPKLRQTPDMVVGVMGNPKGANPELGQKIAEEASRGLALFVEELESKNK